MADEADTTAQDIEKIGAMTDAIREMYRIVDPARLSERTRDVAERIGYEDAKKREEYVVWLAKERSVYWNQCVSVRLALKEAGWGPAGSDEPSVPLIQGVTWLTQQRDEALAALHTFAEDARGLSDRLHDAGGLPR